MMVHSPAELCSMDFYLTHFAMAKSTKIIRHFVCPRYMHNCDRLLLIAKGEFHIKKDDNVVIIARPGDLIYFPDGCSYIGDWQDGEIEYYITQFRLSDAVGVFSLADNICFVTHDKNNTALDICKKITTAWTGDEIAYKIKAHSLFLELLRYIAIRSYKSDIRHNQSDISAAILFLESNYISDVDASELAKMCGMCESKFRSRFHSYAGMPPISYRNFLRVKKAAELLSNGEYNVSETAFLTGFSDIAYFNRVFKKFFGKNPSDYKKD